MKIWPREGTVAPVLGPEWVDVLTALGVQFPSFICLDVVGRKGCF